MDKRHKECRREPQYIALSRRGIGVSAIRRYIDVQRRIANGAIGLLVALALFAALGATQSSANEFPSKPVKIVVSFAAGGPLDVVARKLAESLRGKWNQSVIVENKPGAGTAIATRSVAQSAPDGYTILMTDSALATNDLLHSNLGYDLDKDIAPVTTLVTLPLGIAVSSKLGPITLKEFVEISKSKMLNYGSFGPGSAPYLAMELFKKQTGAKIEHIAYNGFAPVMTGLITGDLQATVTSVGSALPNNQAGTIRMLALTEKSSLMPDVPTFKEAGFPEMDAPAWWAVAAPGGTPPAIVARLSQDIAAALQAPEIKDYLASNGYTPVGDSPESLASRIKSTRALWAPIVAAAGLKAN